MVLTEEMTVFRIEDNKSVHTSGILVIFLCNQIFARELTDKMRRKWAIPQQIDSRNDRTQQIFDLQKGEDNLFMGK